MQKTILATCTAALALLPLPGAHGHEAPSRDTNNRYIKLTPMGDRVRLAYTVYLGEIPGAQARKRMDASGDGIIDDQEAEGYASALAENVRQSLQVTVDGSAHALTWAESHVGLGTAVTSAGALSVDLVAWLCLTADGNRHTVTLRDGVRLPHPGETGLRVQEGPGITITRSALAQAPEQTPAGEPTSNPDARAPRLAFHWSGGQVPLADPGYALAFTVDPETAPRPADGTCGAPEAASAPGALAGRGRTAAVLAALAALLLAGTGLVLRRKRREARLRTRRDR